MGEDEGYVFIFIEEVEHADEGAASHEGIKACLMAAIALDIALHVLVVDVGVGLQQLLVEAGLVERLQVHLYRLHTGLQSAGKDLRVEDEGEELVDLVGELLEGLRERSDEGMVNQTEVQIGEMTNQWLPTGDDLLNDRLKCPGMHWLFLLQSDILFLTQSRAFFFLGLLHKLYLFSAEDADIVFVSFHILLCLVVAHLVFATEVVQYSLAPEVHPRPLINRNYLLDSFDAFTILPPEKYGLCAVVTFLKGFAEPSHFFVLRLRKPAVLDAIAKGMGEVHGVPGQEGHALPLGHEELVEARPVGSGDVEVVSTGDVLPLAEVEERESQLQQGEVQCCLLHPLVKLSVVGEEALQVLQLRDQTRELTVECHEMRGFYLTEDEVEVLVEVGTVDLHCANYIQTGDVQIAHPGVTSKEQYKNMPAGIVQTRSWVIRCSRSRCRFWSPAVLR